MLLAFMPYLIDALSNRGYPEGYELPMMAIMLAIGVLLIHLLGNRNMRSSRTPHILVLIGGTFMVCLLGPRIPVFTVPVLAIGVLLWWLIEKKSPTS
ncbi:MAG: hypothetical protein KDB95_05630 [Flavobacteriales bacterium]|nr:hypothetical protein [Flavobacteriales bacterium]